MNGLTTAGFPRHPGTLAGRRLRPQGWPTPSRSSAPAVTASAPERLPGDPLDPVRARQGRRFINVVLIGALLLYLGVAVFAFGPNGAGLGPMNRLLGWDSPVLAAVPLLLLFWVPMFVLRRLPRRPENSFLCGAQDAIDPTRNPNWRRREGRRPTSPVTSRSAAIRPLLHSRANSHGRPTRRG